MKPSLICFTCLPAAAGAVDFAGYLLDEPGWRDTLFFPGWWQFDLSLRFTGSSDR
jgi:hypothetical protein